MTLLIIPLFSLFSGGREKKKKGGGEKKSFSLVMQLFLLPFGTFSFILGESKGERWRGGGDGGRFFKGETVLLLPLLILDPINSPLDALTRISEDMKRMKTLLTSRQIYHRPIYVLAKPSSSTMHSGCLAFFFPFYNYPTLYTYVLKDSRNSLNNTHIHTHKHTNYMGKDE